MRLQPRPTWAIALALVALGGCGHQESSGGPVLRSKVSARTGHAGPNMRAKPAALLNMGGQALTLQAGGEILFVEPAPTRGSSPTVRVDVRDSAGSKTALVESPLKPDQQIRYRADEPGYLSVHRCTRPASLDERSDAWQLADLCEISHVHVQDQQRGSALRDRHLNTKIGLPIELRPYRSTATLIPGEELPVRLYQKGVPMAQRLVLATNERGDSFEQRTNQKGVATFEINRPGRWVIQAELPDEALPSGHARVRFVFEVPDS